MKTYSGVVIRNYLKKVGFANYKQFYKAFGKACDDVFGRGSWTISPDGVYVSGSLEVPISSFETFVGIAPAAPFTPLFPPAAVRVTPVVPTNEAADEPAFPCDHEGCAYSGFTKKALEAHKKRAGH